MVVHERGSGASHDGHWATDRPKNTALSALCCQDRANKLRDAQGRINLVSEAARGVPHQGLPAQELQTQLRTC